MTPESQLNLRARHPEFQTYLDFNEIESARIRGSYRCYLDERYGSDPLQSMDVFPAAQRNSPILVFIHGGYWKGLDKSSYSFVAEPFVESGVTVAVINYRLLPSVNMSELMNDVEMAIEWVQRESDRFNGAGNSIALSGHSAGGHLALISYLKNRSIASKVKALCCISGIYDLEPIRNSYLNEELQLQREDVTTYSVRNMDLSEIQSPTLISVGADETDFFIEESQELYKAAGSVAPVTYLESEARNHYQIVHGLGKKQDPMVEFLLKQLF